MSRLRSLALLSTLLAVACAAAPAAAQEAKNPIQTALTDRLEARAAQLAVREDSLAARLDSVQKYHLCDTPACAKLRGEIAGLAFKEDSLKGRIRELEADIRALDSTANANGLGPVAPVKVPPVPVDSQKFRQRHLPAGIYLGAMAAGTQLGKLDRDPGGYDATRFYQNKFVAHFSIGYGLEASAERVGVHPLLALGATCVGAHFYDKAQGFYNRRDVSNGCSGAATSYVLGVAGRFAQRHLP